MEEPAVFPVGPQVPGPEGRDEEAGFIHLYAVDPFSCCGPLLEEAKREGFPTRLMCDAKTDEFGAQAVRVTAAVQVDVDGYFVLGSS